LTPIQPDPLNLLDKFTGLDVPELSVLDLGAGLYDSPLSKQMLELPFRKLTAVEIYFPALRHLRTNLVPNNPQLEVIEGDIRYVLSSIPDNSYDVVTMLDSIEHFRRPDARVILMNIMAIARQRVLIWLPLGYCPQGDLQGNIFQRHLSTWSGKEFREMGFDVRIYREFHQHFTPPVDAAWAIWDKESKDEAS